MLSRCVIRFVRPEAAKLTLAAGFVGFGRRQGVENVSEHTWNDTDSYLRIEFWLPIYGSVKDPAAGMSLWTTGGRA
jgi:hypothetical protein